MTNNETQTPPLLDTEQNPSSEAFTHEQLSEFSRVYRNSYQTCLRIAKRYNVRDPESIVQTAFEKALRNWNRYRDTGHSREAWIYKIVANAAIDAIEHETRFDYDSIETLYEKFDFSDSFYYQNNIYANDESTDQLFVDFYMDRIAKVLEKHPRWYEMVKLDLLHFEQSEISKKLDINLGTVKSGLFRAYALLRADEEFLQARQKRSSN